MQIGIKRQGFILTFWGAENAYDVKLPSNSLINFFGLYRRIIHFSCIFVLILNLIIFNLTMFSLTSACPSNMASI